MAVHPDELIFTSSGTESINLAIRGVFEACDQGHLIISVIEHHAVLEPAQELMRRGFKVTTIPVTERGIVDVDTVLGAITDQTRLVSIMLANNEIGTLQPIAEIGRRLHKLNRERLSQNLPVIFFHTDACQAPAFMQLKPNDLKVDLLSINAAKIHGPKGVGLLYVKRQTPLKPQILGGGQEWGLRSGTENVPLIVGFGRAFELAQSESTELSNRLLILRQRLLTQLTKAFPDLRVNGDLVQRLPNNLNLTFPGLDAEALLLYLDQDQVVIGLGSACTTRTLEPSHVLRAIGLSDMDALSTIRLTLGRKTSPTDINAVAKKISQRINWLYKHS